MLNKPTSKPGGLRAQGFTPPLPVAGLIFGKDIQEAAALMPRLFNLCRSAQNAAVRLAFGLPLKCGKVEQVRAEILREHLIKFCCKLPPHFHVAAAPLPKGWQSGTDNVRETLFRPAGSIPQTSNDFMAFLHSRKGVAATLLHIRDCFEPGAAHSEKLPTVTVENALRATALENSVAGRQAQCPVLRDIETVFGRGPFWRATACAYDAEDSLNEVLPSLVSPRPGQAIVTAARDTYAIAASVEDGIVTKFRRVTPTDHLLARGGILDQVLASLPT